jgi:hypothetical protein
VTAVIRQVRAETRASEKGASERGASTGDQS